MATKNLVLTCLVVIFMLFSCNSTQQINPAEARATVDKIWHKDQHTVWEVDWPAAPVGGTLTVENWRFGKYYRFEILESTAPFLVGETLVFNGKKSWYYNRFVNKPPFVISPARLSPITDAFTIIDRLIIATSPPETASCRAVWFNRQQSTLEITLTFSNSDRLVMWYDKVTKLPVKLTFSVGNNSATLKARSFEPLSEPLSGLFEVIDIDK